ncbi:response regulator transcription factor [Roseovarius sp. SCSIO 43702]|uniref:response regulator n=1 Tax=Roseovarius sp. SCSIO 43702 TaxID=2823043 RepID=UPI001C72BD8A|nr:response regulator transcription factor [Roseovarius sp. SCSIO 43702]QYX56461.1 response regulator transcription factor [Roseovarius sp. SCSIO 43702]
MQTCNLAFADDHPVMLSGISQLFASNDEFSVVAVGKTAQDLVEIAKTVKPDVIITDLSMPGRVLEAIATIANEYSGTSVMAFTASTNVDTAIAALEAGAVGYVLKGTTLDDLVDAIRQVQRGETYMSPDVAAGVVAGLRKQASERRTPRVSFSKREEDVLRLLMKGATNREIALALSLTEKTVKHYMTVLIQKLNVRNRVEVVLAAQKLAHGGSMTARTGPLN